ncbi:KIF25 [Acanthosepion pharaonis]|uniref:KIF25 n=1 Tax=Acanthosepion pharaonis TaxID=158019 RepID=A0A812BMS1_ACAPH|nr:KIF25 [Sepia pharaonis]
MPIGIDFKHNSLDKIERYEKELRAKEERIMNLETENAMLRLRIAQLMRSQQATCDGATIARFHYQQQMDSLTSKSKQKIQELKQNLFQTKEEMRQFELKASEQLQHVSRVVHQQLQSSRSECSTVSDLQESVISLRSQLKDITEKHDKEKKKRRQLHNDLMNISSFSLSSLIYGIPSRSSFSFSSLIYGIPSRSSFSPPLIYGILSRSSFSPPPLFVVSLQDCLFLLILLSMGSLQDFLLLLHLLFTVSLQNHVFLLLLLFMVCHQDLLFLLLLIYGIPSRSSFSPPPPLMYGISSRSSFSPPPLIKVSPQDLLFLLILLFMVSPQDLLFLLLLLFTVSPQDLLFLLLLLLFMVSPQDLLFLLLLLLFMVSLQDLLFLLLLFTRVLFGIPPIKNSDIFLHFHSLYCFSFFTFLLSFEFSHFILWVPLSLILFPFLIPSSVYSSFYFFLFILLTLFSLYFSAIFFFSSPPPILFSSVSQHSHIPVYREMER